MTLCHREDCLEAGTQRCSRCKQTNYCSKECQRADWKKHKKQCKKNTGIATDDGVCDDDTGSKHAEKGSSGGTRSRKNTTKSAEGDAAVETPVKKEGAKILEKDRIHDLSLILATSLCKISCNYCLVFSLS